MNASGQASPGRDLAVVLDRGNTRALALACDLDFARTLFLIDPIERCEALSWLRDRAVVLDRDLADALALARSYDLDFTDALARANALGLPRTLDRIGGFAKDVGLPLDFCGIRNIANAIAYPPVPDVAHSFALYHADEPDRGEASRVASPATRLLAIAAHLLPAADRARYGEEYACELRELAQSGAGSLQQVRHALHLLRSAPQTSLALRSPRRTSAVP